MTEDINLRLKDDTDAAQIDYNNLPKQRGTFAVVPQPGRYVLGFAPKQVLLSESKDPTSGEMVPNYYKQNLVDNKARFYITFREQNALLNYGLVSGTLAAIPTPVETMINNNERAVGKAKRITSDMAQLLVALDSIPDKPGNASQMRALMAAIDAKKKFIGDLTLNARCDETKDIYRYDAEQNKTVQITGQKGCGQKFGVEQFIIKAGPNAGKQVILLPKQVVTQTNPETQQEETVTIDAWATRFTCGCSAALNANVQIAAFLPYAG